MSRARKSKLASKHVNFKYPAESSVRHAVAISSIVEILQRALASRAAAAWAIYAAGRSDGYPESNRIFNGDFESDPTHCLFDWRINPTPGTTIDFDPEVRYSERRSLRIRFQGTANVGEIGVGQDVFLEPGRYRFRAYIRTQDVSTNEGVAFHVVHDAAPKQLDFTTQNLKGTNDWTLVECVFDAPPAGGLARVSLTRRPSLKFDNQIKGTVWIDQVRISPVQ
jgi:hypothetical protein